MSRRINNTGHTFDVPLIGATLPEHGLGPRAVHLHAPHYMTLAATGAGKLLTSACHALIGWPGDLVAISEKEDLANFALGRRCDPGIHDDPELVRKFGRRLGVDARGITRARFHLPQGRCFSVDAGGQGAYPTSRYTFLCDVRLEHPGAMARLQAIARGLFPDPKNEAKGDPYWTNAPRDAFAAVCAHVLSVEPPINHNLPYCVQRLLGIDPATGAADPKAQRQLFLDMAAISVLGGYVAAQGLELLTLGERTMGPLMSTIGTRTRWMLADARIRDILAGPTDLSLNEFGRGPSPLSGFFQPSRGDKSSKALLRMFLELAVLVWQQRDGEPSRRILLICDELPAWGREQVLMLSESMNVLRDKLVSVWSYAQSYGPLIEASSADTAASMAAACLVQAFGVRDAKTAEFLRDHIARTSVRGPRGDRHEVDVASIDAIYRELAPNSPLQYVIPYSGAPLRLYRPAFKDLVTREGLRVRGLNYQGHYDEGLPVYDPDKRR